MFNSVQDDNFVPPVIVVHRQRGVTKKYRQNLFVTRIVFYKFFFFTAQHRTPIGRHYSRQSHGTDNIHLKKKKSIGKLLFDLVGIRVYIFVLRNCGVFFFHFSFKLIFYPSTSRRIPLTNRNITSLIHVFFFFFLSISAIFAVLQITSYDKCLSFYWL